MQTGMLSSSDGMVLVVMTVLLEQKLCIVVEVMVEVMMTVQGGWSSSDAHRRAGTSEHRPPAPRTSCSLSANLLGDDGLRCLLEHLPQVPISGSLE